MSTLIEEFRKDKSMAMLTKFFNFKTGRALLVKSDMSPDMRADITEAVCNAIEKFSVGVNILGGGEIDIEVISLLGSLQNY